MTDEQSPREELLAGLGKAFPPQAVKQRQGGGNRMLSYISGDTVIRRLNDVAKSWDFRIVSSEWTTMRQRGAEVPMFMVTGELTIPGLGTRSGIGVQMINDNGGEDLVKGAQTDALKKAAVSFGVGIELYGPDLEAGASSPSSRPAVQRDSSPTPRPQQGNRPASPDERENVTRTLLERAKRVSWSDRHLARWAQSKGFASLGAAPITSLRTLSNWFETHPSDARAAAQRTPTESTVIDAEIREVDGSSVDVATGVIGEDLPDEDEAAAMAFDLAMAAAERAEAGANGDDRFTR